MLSLLILAAAAASSHDVVDSSISLDVCSYAASARPASPEIYGSAFDRRVRRYRLSQRQVLAVMNDCVLIAASGVMQETTTLGRKTH